MKNRSIVLCSVFFTALLLAACAPQVALAPSAKPVEDAVLVISGNVEMAWTLDDLKGLPVANADFTNKDGETSTYSGVSFAQVLKSAGVEKYSAMTLVAADDYTIDIDQKTLDACADCIIAIGDDGSLRAVMPGMQGSFQVRDLVELQVK